MAQKKEGKRIMKIYEAYLNALFARADAIDRKVSAADQRCERLTQAVLGKAFRGKVVKDNL